MAISPIPQAPFRQDRRLFPTPLVSDILFSEVRDCSRISFPEYGTYHPDSKKWPHHKLVFIKPVDIERDGLFEFFYAADREFQDLYNFAFLTRNVAGREFRTVVRTYITARDKFDPLTPAFGTPMPDVPESTFDGVSYFLYEKIQQRNDQQELDSLYVTEQITYAEQDLLDLNISAGTERPILLPEKFRAALPTVTTEKLVEGMVSIPTLDADDIAVTEDQVNAGVKRVRNVSRAPQTEEVVLNGTRAYVEGTNADVVETFSPEELEADTGLLISQSIASPLGDGSFIKETIKVDSWPELKSSEWDYELNTAVVRTEQFVAPPADLNQPNTTFRAVNKDRTLKIVESPPVAALSSYYASFPTEVDLRLPNVLKQVYVVWSEDKAEGASDVEWNGFASGTSYSLSGQESGDATSSGSLRPEVVVEIEQPWGANIPATAYFFYIESDNNSVSESSFLSRLTSFSGSVQRWPLFRPVSHTIIAQGAKVAVRADAQGSASYSFSQSSTTTEKSEGSGESYDVGLALNSVNIPPTIHEALTISGAEEKTITVNAKSTADWVGFNFPSVNVVSEASHSIKAKVTPTSLAATSPAAIPTAGLYVVQSRIEPYKWGWSKCSAIVIDANHFA